MPEPRDVGGGKWLQLFGRKASSLNVRDLRIPSSRNEERPSQEGDPPGPPNPWDQLFPSKGPSDFVFPITSSEDSFGEGIAAPTTTEAIDTAETSFVQPTSTSNIPAESPTASATGKSGATTGGGPKTSAIVAGSVIGGIALIAILYLAFMFWRRSRMRKLRENLKGASSPPTTAPPTYDTGGPPMGFIGPHELERSQHGQPRNFSWGNISNPASEQQDRSRPQENRHSQRYYAAVLPPDNASDDSMEDSLDSRNSPGRALTTHNQQPSGQETFVNLPVLAESSQENLPRTSSPPLVLPPAISPPISPPLASTTNYRQRRNSRENSRSLTSSISTNHGYVSPNLGGTDYDWQHVSYPSTGGFGQRDDDVSPIEPTGADSLPFSRQNYNSTPLSVETRVRSPHIRPNSIVSSDGFDNVDISRGRAS
ncbi:hypothetical protein FQN55_005943 [Onygenales sp. PD_40]|nr:hypothetical protein FQN55_005943 [Onygenales sp. PD_40]KAK2787904.1 hypothetical protein FQN53_004345 [Emmonsiellopsis sp. PD_33]KAK2791946.1 hypothetical protein FQN52_004388 [Onygenales sp. PD_12]KAK2801052.1 hypothetical protein FQN51_005616 [Onygenales sp. PD_10]